MSTIHRFVSPIILLLCRYSSGLATRPIVFAALIGLSLKNCCVWALRKASSPICRPMAYIALHPSPRRIAAERFRHKDVDSFRARGKWLNSLVSFRLRLHSDPLTSNSGSAYRGSNPWGAAKLESMAYDLRFPPKQPTGNKNR